jgi:nicotinamide-nucleotide amidase
VSASEILDFLKQREMFLVLAESITGGGLCKEFTSIPGSSKVLLTSVVAYDTDLKHELLGVSKQLLDAQGPVDPEVAAQMAEGLRKKIATKKLIPIERIVAISSTGVAGPETQGGKPVGEIYLAISQGGEDQPRVSVFSEQLSGSRAEIQESAVLLGVRHLWEEIRR